MKISDYSQWILNEVKESRIFTILNILGIWINVAILVIFLSLALGIEETVINQITKNINLFTIEVQSRKYNELLSFDNFSFLAQDNRVKQIVPVINEYAELRLADSSNKTLEDQPSELVYVENYYNTEETNEDLRTNNLNLVDGKKISDKTTNGIIVSEILFNKLVDINKGLNKYNYQAQTFYLDIKRKEDQIKSFPCKIIGIAKATQYRELVYIAFPLAIQIDNWVALRTNSSLDYKQREYERFDFVTNNLEDLKEIRKQFIQKKYDTRSVLDRINNVRKILLIVKMVFYFIIGISILISTFNLIITLISYVLKRKKDIGILKSLGATNIQIQLIFIYYAICLCLFGSLLGIITALILILVINFGLYKFGGLTNISLFKINTFLILNVVLSTVLIGMFASLIPAKQAASLDPIETMRGN